MATFNNGDTYLSIRELLNDTGLRKNNFEATTNPSIDADTTEGYEIGSLWLNTNTNEIYYAVDVTNAAAVWRLVSQFGNAEVQAYLTAQGYSNVDLDAQTLTWDSANSNLSISNGNTITMDAPQTLSYNTSTGNIAISSGNYVNTWTLEAANATLFEVYTGDANSSFAGANNTDNIVFKASNPNSPDYDVHFWVDPGDLWANVEGLYVDASTDIELYALRDIDLDAQTDVDIRANEDINMTANIDINMTSLDDITLTAVDKISLFAENYIWLRPDQELYLESKQEIFMESYDQGYGIQMYVDEANIPTPVVNVFASNDGANVGLFSINGTANITGTIDDDTMVTASNTTLATSESIKAYVDAIAGGGSNVSGLYTIESSSAGGSGPGNANVRSWIGCPAATTAVDKIWTVKHNTDDGYVYAIVTFTFASLGYTPAIQRSGFGGDPGDPDSFFSNQTNNLTGCSPNGSYFPTLLRSVQTYANVDDIPPMGYDSEGYIQYLGNEFSTRGFMIGGTLNTQPQASRDGVAIGSDAEAGINSVAIGLDADASTNYTTAVGWSSIASGAAAAALGHECEATGSGSIAMGSDSTASSSASMAIGYKSDVQAAFSTSIGWQNDISTTGSYTISIGNYLANNTYTEPNAIKIAAGDTYQTQVEVRPNYLDLSSTGFGIACNANVGFTFTDAINGNVTLSSLVSGGSSYGIDESTRSESTDWLKIISNGNGYDVLTFNTDSSGAGSVADNLDTADNGGYQFQMGTSNQRIILQAPGNKPKITGWANGLAGDTAGLTIEGRSFTATEGYLRLEAGSDQAIEMVNGSTTINSANATVQGNLTADSGIVVNNGTVRLANLTTTERNGLAAGNGDMIYNVTDGKLQGYQAGAWINLDGS